MIKLKRSGIALILIFCISFMFMVAAAGQADTVPASQETLAGISSEEKAVLEELFILSQEIEEMGRKQEELDREAAGLQNEISKMEGAIKERQKSYDLQLEILKQVLAAYQKNGPASFLETLLSADDQIGRAMT